MKEQMILPSPVIHHIGWNPAKMKNVLRSPLKIHGGKFFMSESLLNLAAPAMAVTKIWHEPCVGGANFSLQSRPKTGAPQILCDSDPLTANVWRVFTNEPLAIELLQRLATVGCRDKEEMQAEFAAASSVVAAFDAHNIAQAEAFNSWDRGWQLAMATAFIVNRRMSRGGNGDSFCWQDRERGGQPGEINSWRTFVLNHAPRVVERCRNMIGICVDAIRHIDPNTSVDGGIANASNFYYFDPPYKKETRTVPNIYRRDAFNHERFIELLASGDCKALCAVSGYAHPLYDSNLTLEKGWTRHDFHIVNNSSQGEKKADRIESVYINF